MDNLMSGGLAKMAGEKAGEVVETVVKNVMGGNKKEEEGEKAGGAAFNPADLLSLGDGDKKEGGLDVGNVLSSIAGGQKEGGDGGGVQNMVKGLFG